MYFSFLRPRGSRALALAGLALAAGLIATPRLRAQETVFGSAATPGQAALIGILYDTKQTQQREPTKETPTTYRDIIAQFLQSNWDEDVFNRYFRVTRAVYTTQVFIPSMNADEAPKAFGVADIVQPRMWVVHYKGQVAPPESGIYRFVGNADDILAVRINGRTILVAGRQDCLPPPTVWQSPEPLTSDDTTYGDWISLKGGEIVDFDAIIGERPGGIFRALLWIQKQGGESDPPPIFKLAQGAPPVAGAAFGPDTKWSVWKAMQ